MEECAYCGEFDHLNAWRECRDCFDAGGRYNGRLDGADRRPIDSPSLSDYRNEAGEWMASPEQIRADMNWQPDPADYYDDLY